MARRNSPRPDMVGESRGQWYLRQMLGSANFDAGPALAFMSGNLCYQIEHHLYPDLPSNRLSEIAVRVRAVCDKYGLALHHRLIPAAVRQGVADHCQALAAEQVSARYRQDDAPETRSEQDVHPTRARIRPDRPGDRPSPRVEDSDLDGAAVAP